MDLLSCIQALMGVVLIVPGIFFILHSKKSGVFTFKLGKSGAEVTGANAGMFLLLMGVLLLFLCRLNYQEGLKLKTENNKITATLEKTEAQVDSIGQVNQDLDNNLKLAYQQKTKVPDIKGLSQEQAIAKIKQSGLNVGRVDTVSADRIAALIESMEFGKSGGEKYLAKTAKTRSLTPGSVIEQKFKTGEVIGLKTKVDFMVVGSDSN